jgi:hypothetical protein
VRQSNPEDTAHYPARLSWGAQNDPGVVSFDPLQKSSCEEKAQQSSPWFGPGPDPDVGVGVRSETFGFWTCHRGRRQDFLGQEAVEKRKGELEIIVVVVRGLQK